MRVNRLKKVYTITVVLALYLCYSAVNTDLSISRVLRVLQEVIVPPHVEKNLMDKEKYFSLTEEEKTNITPFFWHVPKSAGTSLHTYYSKCYNLVDASEIGASASNEDDLMLMAKSDDGIKNHINVDVSNGKGIQRAKKLDLVPSGLAEIILTQEFNAATRELFDPRNQGACFAMFRHPVDRVISLFYYLQDATWETTYNPDLAAMTIDDYANSPLLEANYVTRSLTGKMEGMLSIDDTQTAVEILRTKCVVGLADKFDESIKFFNDVFGFTPNFSVYVEGETNGDFDTKKKRVNECLTTLRENGGANRHSHPKLSEESDTYKTLERKNGWDMLLWKEILKIYEEQKELNGQGLLDEVNAMFGNLEESKQDLGTKYMMEDSHSSGREGGIGGLIGEVLEEVKEVGEVLEEKFEEVVDEVRGAGGAKVPTKESEMAEEAVDEVRGAGGAKVLTKESEMAEEAVDEVDRGDLVEQELKGSYDRTETSDVPKSYENQEQQQQSSSQQPPQSQFQFSPASFAAQQQGMGQMYQPSAANQFSFDKPTDLSANGPYGGGMKSVGATGGDEVGEDYDASDGSFSSFATKYQDAGQGHKATATENSAGYDATPPASFAEGHDMGQGEEEEKDAASSTPSFTSFANAEEERRTESVVAPTQDTSYNTKRRGDGSTNSYDSSPTRTLAKNADTFGSSNAKTFGGSSAKTFGGSSDQMFNAGTYGGSNAGAYGGSNEGTYYNSHEGPSNF